MKKTLFIFLGLIAWMPSMAFAQVTSTSVSDVACTMDAMLCPDGITSVGRVAPTCAFAPCPSIVLPTPCVDIKNNLRLGSTDAVTSAEVSVLQGFLFPRHLSVRPTGRFLGMTQSAVIAFQREQGIIPASGIVGPLTRAKIRELTCGNGNNTFLPTTTPVPTPSPVFQGSSNSVSIASLDPAVARVGQSVIIRGNNFFRPETKLLFDGMSISGRPVYERAAGAFNSAFQFTVPDSIFVECVRVKPTDPCPLAPARQVTPGMYQIAVENNLGRASVNFTVTGSNEVNPKLEIISLSPSAGMVGVEVVIRGTGINVGNDEIYFGGSLVSKVASVASDEFSTLRFRVPTDITPCGVGGQNLCRIASRPVTPGVYDVVVVNRNGTSNGLNFTVTAPNTTVQPEITSLTPASLRAGEVLTINGKNFPNFQTLGFLFLTNVGTGIQLPAIEQFIGATHLDNSSTQTRFTIPTTVPLGTYRASIRFGGGVQSAPSTQTIQIVNTPAINPPQITSISPTTASPGAEIVINGQRLNFGDPRIVLNDTIFVTPNPTRSSDNLLVFTLPALSAVPHTVRVTNSAGTSNAVTLNVVNQQTVLTPVITSFNPTSIQPGQILAVNGTNFPNFQTLAFLLLTNSVTGVQLPAVAANHFENSPTQTQFTIPTTVPAGNYRIAIRFGSGVQSAQPVQTLVVVTPSAVNPPQITSISPTSASIGSQITITGTRLGTSGDARIVLNNTGVIIPDSTRAQDGILVFTLPESMSRFCQSGVMCTDDMIPVVAGKNDVRVVNSSGTSNAVSLNVVTQQTTPAPSISSLSPIRGTVGTRVTIVGQNISSQSDFVRFGSVRVTPDRTVTAPNTVVFQVPNALLECNPTPTNPCLTIPLPTNMTYDLTVERPNGTASNMLTFRVLSQDFE